MNQRNKKIYLNLIYEDLFDYVENNFERIKFKDIIFTEERRQGVESRLGNFDRNPYLTGLREKGDVRWNELKKDISTRLLVPFVVKRAKADNKVFVLEGFHRFIMIEELVKEGKLSADVELPCVIKRPDFLFEELSNFVRRINQHTTTLNERFIPPDWLRYK